MRIQKLRPDAVLPKYAHGPAEDAGMDLCAVEDTTLEPGVPHEITGTLDKAVAAAARDAETSAAAEAVVLLSPACASFDQYRNFEVRGDAFRELVRALPGVARR